MENRKKIILTMIYDLRSFPPVISICNILSELNYDIVYIGTCSDPAIEKMLSEENHVKIYRTEPYGGNSFLRFVQQWKYKRFVLKILKDEYENGSTYLWLLHSETVSLFANLLGKYNIVSHLFEFKNPMTKLAYRVLTPFARFDRRLNLSTKVICCEYNRAQLTKALYKLDKLPCVLPNKPYLVEQNKEADMPKEMKLLLEKYQHKKIILYQGIFISERKLDDYIMAVNSLPDEYVMFLMGSQNALYYQLKKEYESDRIVFLPFFSPPLHLEVTKRAYIGILTYIPDEHTIEHAVNVLFCAPNKLYEYSKFGKPMISNDLPALKFAFSTDKAGVCINEMESNQIVDAIKEIDANYATYEKASLELYERIDMLNIIRDLL